MSDLCCRTCVFFLPQSATNPDKYGLCRRFPPLLDNSSIVQNYWLRPEIHPSDWCGEWAAQEKEDE